MSKFYHLNQKSMKGILLIVILFFFNQSKIKAQCPEGDIQFLSQSDVDDFVSAYPNCTHITGYLKLGVFLHFDSDINDISGLQNITKIDGDLGVFGTRLTSLNGLNNLNELGGLNIVGNFLLTSINELINITEISNGQIQIAENPLLLTLDGLNNIQEVQGRLYLGLEYDGLLSIEALNNLKHVGGNLNISLNDIVDLTGLDNLEYIGGNIQIARCENIININALSNTTYVGGMIYFKDNPNLTSLDGIQNFQIATEGETIGIYLKDNMSLSQCSFPNICQYLGLGSIDYPREINGNSGNCSDEQSVLAACDLKIDDVNNIHANWNVFYKKDKGSFLVQSDGFKIAEIEVFDLTGRLIKRTKGLNTNTEELKIFSAEKLLIVKVISTIGESFVKKVALK